MKKILLTLTLPILLIGTVLAGISYSDKVLDWPSQNYDRSEAIDLKEWSRFSLQAIYSAASLSADTISDGTKANTSITVTNYATLNAAKASVTVEIATITDLTGESVTLNGIVFKAGTDFVIGASTTTAAANLTLAVAAHPDFEATSSGSTMTATAADYGTAPNLWTSATSDGAIIVVGAATFASGVAQHCLNFWDLTTLCEGDDWDAATSETITAQNIQVAMNADAALSAVIVSTDAVGVVYSTMIAPGYVNNFITATSTNLTVSAGGIVGGSASAIAASTFTESAHGYQTGIGMLMNVVSGTAPQGLVDETTYYAIVHNENLYSVASSTTNAIAGTEITVSTFTGGGSFTLTPLALSGTPSFKWQASNDNTNWSDLALSSVTYSAAGNTLWDVGDVDYRYIRINYVGPTTGGLDLEIWQAGKRD